MVTDLQQKIESIISSNPQADERKIMFQLKQLLYETEMQGYTDGEAKSIADLVAENMQQLDSETYQNAIIKSGFEDLDTIGGFRLGEFIVIGGRPSMGKTQFLINLSLNISTTVPVLYITFDESEFMLTNRFMSSVAEIMPHKILRHDLSEAEKKRISIVGDEFAKRQLFIHDACNSSIAALKITCQKQIQENGIQVIVIDYLQRISSYKHKNYRELEINHICRELKNMAKEWNVCVMVSSQLSRAVETRGGTKRPMLSDLRDSGAIEQDADKVLFIYRPEYYAIEEDEKGCTRGMVDIIVAKNRNGHIGEIRLRKDDHCTNIRPIIDEFTFSSDRLKELAEGLGF